MFDFTHDPKEPELLPMKQWALLASPTMHGTEPDYIQKAYESVLGRTLVAANFRRKIADYVTETEQILEGAGHRPARLFRRNLEAFYR